MKTTTEIYSTDNGAILCRKHLGCCAATTGRDTSGQKIERLSAGDLAELALMVGRPVGCEQCEAAR